MRLKEDNSSWRSGGIKRRMYRQAPLLPEEEVYKGHPKRKQKAAKSAPRCKHVWVEVSPQEYARYRWGGGLRIPSWFRYYDYDEPYWRVYTDYYVCAGCLATKNKVDKGKRREYYRRNRKR